MISQLCQHGSSLSVRFINDTWPAPAGPLYRPIRPRFLGPGFRPDRA